MHRRNQGWAKGPCPPKFLENIVILCFERRFFKQNSVIRLQSHILVPRKVFWPPPNFWAGYATGIMSFATYELPTFTLNGSTCKTYSMSIIPGREQSKILP